ncbi:MAG: TerB family tellurite resistance protein [Bacteroidales bacterium]|nr:TerB family tellurite resistance protein [Bacteroidales bacterium]MDY0140598.1 TerB family tellurite resistance protein [Bacteroidales bacterium]
MVKLGKWIGGGLGWAFGGPIGALFGFFIGSFFDNARISTSALKAGGQTQRGDFMLTFLVLSAAVMKADRVVKKSELEFVKRFLLSNFSESETKEALQILKELLEKDIPLDDVCQQVRRNMSNPLKLQILHYLFGISAADGVVHKDEINLIEQIATKIGLTQHEYKSVMSMFVPETDSAYEILGIDKNATNDDIKKAYRSMAIKHHPDKVASMGKDIENAAKKKFQSINEAYNKIKAERGIK